MELTRASAGILVAAAVIAGLTLRLADLDARPMHHDEANQALKFAALLERGEYRYDPHDHHGPTLYYLSLPAAILRGQASAAALDERTLRAVAVVFGTATILLLPLLSGGLGRTAVAAAAILMAVSPAMTFYARMYIQEALFACFTLAFVIAAGRVAVGGGLAWSAVAGLAAGLAIATKETWVIVVPAALAACVFARWSLPPLSRPPRPDRRGLATASATAVLVAAAVAALFFSSFLSNPASAVEPLKALGTYLDRGIDPAAHAQPWHYYLGLLAYSSSGGLRWTEAPILVLAAAGLVAAWRAEPTPAQRAFWMRHLAAYVVIASAIFSAVPYKTPWNLLPFYAAAVVLAGVGFSRLVRAPSSRAIRAVLIALFVVATGHLAWQAWRASVTYPADPRNPYVYAQSVPDAVRMAARIRGLAAVHPDGERMLVAVIAHPYDQWPLPWYLRTMSRVGYWTAPGEALALGTPVVVASLDHAPAVEAALGERYVSETYGLRPDVLLALYIERGLWERFLAHRASSRPPDGCADAVRSRAGASGGRACG